MSRYKSYLASAFCILFFNACALNQSTLDNTNKKRVFAKVKHKEYRYENIDIIYALESERLKDYKSTQVLYKRLFERTNRYEYFVKYLEASFFLKEYNEIISSVKTYKKENIKEEELIGKWYIHSLNAVKKYQEAIKEADALVNKYNNLNSYKLLAASYYHAKEFNKSYEYFHMAYKIRDDISTILVLSDIKYKHLNKKQEAIAFLKKSIDLKQYDYTLSLQLISFYRKSREYQKLNSFLKEVYLYNHKYNRVKQVKEYGKIFLSYSFSLNDVNSLIAFLEEVNKEDRTLYELYRKANKQTLAYEFLQKSYTKNKNIEDLAQMAILEYEMADDKTLVLQSVIKKFEKVLETSKKARYENYLAYLLIDHDIDVKKGLLLVKKALKKRPKNLAYLDTLAWGEYKLNNCKKAYVIMEDIVKKAGLSDEEIKLHWEKIKECK